MERANVNDCEFDYEGDEPEGYRAGLYRPGPGLGAKETGMSVYELPPGQSICPYHYEYAEEEWLVALGDGGVLRTPEGEEELAAGDVAFFPTGPGGAHKVTNGGEQTVRVLMFSAVRWPAATVYPDSDKIGVFTDPDRTDNLIARRSSGVDYFDGESDGG